MKPREKILKYGPEKLEGHELVATILGSGIKGLDVFKLSRQVFKIIEVKKENITLKDLENIKGIGKVKAIAIISAFQLAQRYFIKDYIIIDSLEKVLEQVKEYRLKKQEYLICLTLDGANRLINKRVVTIGILNQSLVHPREIFAPAIEDRANSIILIHNHPSESCFPSDEDIKITKRIKEVSDIVGINLLDHVIITKSEEFSFKNENIL